MSSNPFLCINQNLESSFVTKLITNYDHSAKNSRSGQWETPCPVQFTRRALAKKMSKIKKSFIVMLLGVLSIQQDDLQKNVQKSLTSIHLFIQKEVLSKFT